MKSNIINKCLIAGAVAVLGGLVSCEDYLTIYPTDSITKEDFWGSRNDVDNVRNAAYYQLTRNTDKILIWGEFRSDNVELNKTEKNEYRRLLDGVLEPTQSLYDWSGMYKGINLCNEVLDNGERMVRDKVDPSFTETDFASVKSEMIALRALYYFYLVRAYRDVPYVVHSVSTDHEARLARVEAMPGNELMERLIADLEENLPKGTKSFGSDYTNRNRLTQNGMHALLADMYLWRAGMVKNATAKGFPIKDSTGKVLTAAQENALSNELLEKCIKHTDFVMQAARDTYAKYLQGLNVTSTDYRATQRYPLLRNAQTQGSIADEPYNAVFGAGSSIESIFELYHDANNVRNNTVVNLLYSVDGGTRAAGIMVAGSGLFNATEKVDMDKGYGKTDLRMASYGLITDEKKNTTTPIIKMANRGTTNIDPKNVRNTQTQHDFRTNNAQDASWPIYRLTDIMTIRAEAIARLKASGNPSGDLKEVYMLVDDIYRRNNPGADTLNTSDENFSRRIRADRLDKQEGDAANPKKTQDEVFLGRHPGAAGAAAYVAAERQREFIGEGKRWFDIVRECEFSYTTTNKTKSGLEWAGLSAAVRNRLQSIWSLYNPIFVDELRVNGKNYFGNSEGKLVQNPAWEKYMPKTNN